MHAASVNPEPGSNSPKIAQLALRLHSEGSTTRTSITDFLSLFSCQGAATGARQSAARIANDGASPPWCQTRRPSDSVIRVGGSDPREGGTTGILEPRFGACQTPDAESTERPDPVRWGSIPRGE